LSASLSAQDRVIELLRTLHDARVDWDGRADGNGVLLMPSMWNEGSYPELVRCLIDLREHQRPLWWHVCHRYRFGETRMIMALVNRKRGGDTFHLPKRTELVAGGPSVGSKHALCRVYQWSERVSPELVTEGIDVLTASMYDGREDRIWLPAAVYDRLMGRLLKVAA
jgi:hypothetical protein